MGEAVGTLLARSLAVVAIWLLRRKDEPLLLRKVGAFFPLTGRWRRYLIAAALLVPAALPLLQQYAGRVGLHTVLTNSRPLGCTGPIYDVPQGFSLRRSVYPIGHSACYARAGDWIVGVIKLER